MPTREKRVAGFYLLAFFDVEVGHDSLAIGEHLQRPGGGYQKAGHGLLARELRKAKKDDGDRHDRGKQPSQQLCRYRLQQRDLAKFALAALKLDRFLAKQLSRAHRFSTLKYRAPGVMGARLRRKPG